MQALIYNNKLTYVSDYPKPVADNGEAVIKVQLAGICATDLEIVKGYMGFEGILGHEFVGIVESAQESRWLGKRVVGSINAACRTCTTCLSQGPEHCPTRTVLGIFKRDGVFAEYVTLPEANLFEVPAKVSDQEAVFVEPLAAAVKILEQVPVRPTAKTAVVGPGRLGILIGQVLAINGTDVTMLGRSESSLSFSKKLGLSTAYVHEISDDSYDFVVEATGNPEGFSQSLRIIRPGGTIILKSTFASKKSIDLTKVVVAEINMVGSRCGPFAPALRLLAHGKVSVMPLIEAQYNLEDGLQAFQKAALPGTKKILLKP